MSNIVELTKVLIKNNILGFSGMGKKSKGSSSGSIVAFVSLIVFCVLCLGAPVIFLLSDILKNYDLSEVILSFIIPIGGLTSIIFGVFSIVSVFYFSKDSESLLPLPIKSSELLIAKFITSLISEYMILLMFIYPIILGVGIGINASFLYYLYTVIICFLMPIIPSVIMSIVIMLVNKIFNFSRRKNLFMYIMTGFIFVFAFGYSFSLQYFMDIGSNEESVLALMSGDFSGLLNTARWLFPLFNSAVYSLSHFNEFIGLASMLSFIGLNLLAMVILYLLGDKLYIKGLTKDGGTRASKKVDIKDKYKENSSSVMMELIKKEWVSIKRSPVFMLNIVIVNMIMPIVFGMSFFIGFTSESEGASIKDLLNIDFNNSGILLISIALMLFLISFASASSSAISREGNSAWMMKTIPISLKKQLDAKVYFSMIIEMVILVAMEVIFMFFFDVPYIYLLLVNVPVFLISLISNYLHILLDLRKPKLDWKEESEAVKQNFNVFVTMMVSWLIICALAVVGILLLEESVNIYLVFALVSVVLLLCYILLIRYIEKNQVKLFSKVG